MSPFAVFALVLAITACVPLAMNQLVGRTGRRAWSPPYLMAALTALVSILVPDGPIAAMLAAAWLAFAAVLAGRRLTQSLVRSTFRLEEAVIDAALAYLVVGAGWLVVWRSGGDRVGIEAHS